MVGQTPHETREPYSTPKLTIYGKVVELTRQVGLHRSSDGGTLPTIRTQF